MTGQFSNIEIAGIKAVVPPDFVDNMQFSDALGERRCKKQIKLTGVEHRHISPPQQTSADLAYEAGKFLLDELGWDPNSIDVLIFITQNPVYALPSTAFLLQKRLGIHHECTVFDINLGCSAATVGIQVVSSLLQQARKDARGLLLTSDQVYASKSEKEIAPDRLLFGSAGSAVALQKTEKTVPKIVFQNKSDGWRHTAIQRDPYASTYMDGEAVFNFGINDVASDVCAFRDAQGLRPLDIDYYVFHQAQALMLSTMDECCEIPPERELRTLQEYGNTSGSSILLTLSAHAEMLRQKDVIKVLLCGFGVGLSWCTIITDLSTKCIFPVSFSDRYYGSERIDEK